MTELILVNHPEKYDGKYVALKSFLEKDVVCFGEDPLSVYNKAKSSGCETPVVFYVPQKGMVHIYRCR